MQPNNKDILGFIQAARDSFIGAEHVYMHGSCYYFAKMLEVAFPGGQLYENFSHVVYAYEGKFYDIRGHVYGKASQSEGTHSYVIAKEPTRHGKFDLIEYKTK